MESMIQFRDFADTFFSSSGLININWTATYSQTLEPQIVMQVNNF